MNEADTWTCPDLVDGLIVLPGSEVCRLYVPFVVKRKTEGAARDGAPPAC